MKLHKLWLLSHQRDPELAALLRAQVALSLRPTAIGLMVVYLTFTLSHLLFLTGSARILLMSIAGLSALGFGVYGWMMNVKQPSIQSTHVVAALFVVVALFNSFAHLLIQRDILQTTNVAFCLIAAGGFLLSLPWILGLMITTLFIWIMIIQQLPPSPYVVHLTFALMSASMLSIIFFQLRMRMFAALNDSRRRERQYHEQLEAAMQETLHTAERFKALSQATTEGVVIYNAQGIVDVNDSFVRLVGLRYEQIIGQSIIHFVHPDDRQAALQQLLTKPDDPYEVRLLKPDGTTTDVVVRGKVVNYNGEPMRIVALADISAQKEIERTLRHAKDAAEHANHAKTRFLSIMSHELRTPLNAIIGYSELVREDLNERGINDLNREIACIVTAGDHLLLMINDVLELVQVEAENHTFRREEVLVDHVIFPLVEAFRHKASHHNTTIKYAPQPSWGQIVTDVGILSNVLRHVLDNAVKFTINGTVAIDVQHSDSPDGRLIHFVINDTGIGIPAEHLERVFEPFAQVDDSSTRRFDGAGMGLTITQRLCALLGGSIQIESTAGQGTTCTITLPVDLVAA